MKEGEGGEAEGPSASGQAELRVRGAAVSHWCLSGGDSLPCGEAAGLPWT